MGFSVNLYTLSKRDNSTKRPASGSGTTYSCVMKHGCGILHPTITLNLGLTSDPSQYNYAYIPAFERFYFIEEWFFEDALWSAQLKVDVLATYKTEIGNSRLYVLRASNDYDGRVIDNLYPTKTGCNFVSNSINNPFDWDNLCYVVGVVSRGGNMGSMAYYAMTGGNMQTMCQNLLDPGFIVNVANGFDLEDASEALQLSLIDPMQYIKSCIAIPLSYGNITGSGANVYAYNWYTGATGKRLYLAPYESRSYTFRISKHPDTSSRGNYVNSSPYTVLTLSLPPFGVIELDTSVTCNASSITVSIVLDPITGKASATISCNGIILNRVEAMLGVPISLSSVTRDYVGGATSAIGGVAGGVGNVLTGNVGGALSSVATGIGNAIEAMKPRAQTMGSGGGFALNMGKWSLEHQFFRPVSDDITHNGRPLCQVRKISNLGGYMLIQDGDVTINGTSTEDAEIRNYLETGFYYE